MLLTLEALQVFPYSRLRSLAEQRGVDTGGDKYQLITRLVNSVQQSLT